MAMAVPSRFACLKIEDDDFRPKNPNKEKNCNNKKKPAGNNKSEPKKTTKGNPNPKNLQQNKKKKNDKSTEQWEQWKQKDNELVDECYEDDLQQALLLSKLEFEEKKHLNKQKKCNEVIGKSDNIDGKEKKTKNKSKVMSLDQFNNLMSGNVNEEVNVTINQEVEENFENDKEFFSRLQMDTKEELSKEHMRETIQVRQPPTTEIITSAQYKEQLEKKDEEIQKLRAVVDDLKAELLTVKTRNKKLCSILGQGEMRDKAEVLVEVDRLTRVQVELTAEVQSLHAQLEQEKSKVHYLTEKDHKGKDKKKRDNAATRTD
ncbi:LOW QUALITY PROTEIN: G kinase-anchoring protein 1-like [Ctenocephalides felis]|uniref:LOW QUALITY PROTEIN: G kinase-anchoring protein 1-like n=1 Tax=Ctenocephalides felis TaxID=7515 RepID=UPI000E6E5421|nr:LOW QUALITY PROTEIN: G kinase-anchoring protein 1-like [Ctenocephalides felis]